MIPTIEKYGKYYLALSFLWAWSFASVPVHAQSIQAAGQNYMTINDKSILLTGQRYPNNMSVQFNGGNSSMPQWKLTVQPLTAYFVAQQSSAADIAQFGYGPNWPNVYFSIKFNLGASQNSWSDQNSISKIGVAPQAFTLGSSEITLVERSGQPIRPNDYFSLAFDLILTGNQQMLSLHRDNYILVMRYRLYNQNGVLVNQTDYSHQIGLWPAWLELPQSPGPQYVNSIQLQNGASNVTLDYGNQVAAYRSGVEQTIPNGLVVSSSDGKYQVSVQTLGSYFTKSGSTARIPVNLVRLTPSASGSVTSTYTAIDLSQSSRTIIVHNGTTGASDNYTLKYSTRQNPNQDAFLNAEAGTYETQVTFVMSPL